MGCFNTVFIECPQCGENYKAQSKAGSCSFKENDLHKSEKADVIDLDERVFECKKCKTKFYVAISVLTEVRVLKTYRGQYGEEN